MGDPRVGKPTPAQIAALSGSYLTHPIYANTVFDYLYNEGDGVGTTLIGDISGNGLTMTYPQGVNGFWQDNGLLYNGFGHRSDTVTSSLLTLVGDLSIEMWMKFNTSDTNPRVLYRIFGQTGDSETETANTIAQLDTGTVASPDIDLRYLHEHDAGINQLDIFNTTLANDIIYHLVIVRDTTANTVKMYVDGVLVDTFNYSDDPTLTSDPQLHVNSTNLSLICYRLHGVSRAWSNAEVFELFDNPYGAFNAKSRKFIGGQTQINADLANVRYLGSVPGPDTMTVTSEDAAGRISITDIPITVIP